MPVFIIITWPGSTGDVGGCDTSFDFFIKSRHKADELSTFYEIIVYFLHKILSANLASVPTSVGITGTHTPSWSAPGAGPVYYHLFMILYVL